MASTSDKVTDIRNAARPNSARVTSGRSASGTALSCDNLAGWPTASKVHFVTYQIDSNENPVDGTQLDCSGLVSGNNIGSLAVIDGTDNGNSVGDVVEMLPTAAWGQDLADALQNDHDRVAYHKTLHDANGNEWIKQSSVAMAVNEFTISNAIAGDNPVLSTTGNDSNINLVLTPKGTGNIKKGSNNIDAWEELGRTVLSGAGDTISVTPITAKKYIKLQCITLQSGQIAPQIRFNNDSANNYAYRTSANGGADSTSVSQGKILISPTETSDQYLEYSTMNLSANEKMGWGFSVSFGTAGAGNAPTRIEGGGKWANTAAQITRVDIVNAGTGDFASGSELVVYGHD